MQRDKVVVIGAGLGGMSAALRLAANGVEVIVCERAAMPGGKARTVDIGALRVDAGPTVLTMRWVFDELFSAAGAVLDDHLRLSKLAVLARHYWPDGASLDLFDDKDKTADAIGAMAGGVARRGYLEFAAEAKATYEALADTFIAAQRPSMPRLVARIARQGVAGLGDIKPFTTLWGNLGRYFSDPRLRQLFARYATYCGSSPYRAPATLMLVAHVETMGVWTVDGGIDALVVAIANLAKSKGVAFRYGAHVSEIIIRSGRAGGVRLASGEAIEAGSVIVNTDAAAFAEGLLGTDVARVVAPIAAAERSLSAVTVAATARAGHLSLARHTVFFSSDYRAEFADLERHARIPRSPTVYVCAQDRHCAPGERPPDRERLLFIVNAPPADGGHLADSEIDRCIDSMTRTLASTGATLTLDRDTMAVTTPANFAAAFPGTAGAIYGMASHGWTASFRRPGARTKLPRLYLAGGSVHPGPGMPMATISGRLAAESILADFASTRRSVPAAMPGGTSMGSVTTGAMD